ncbi:MAG: hypothetical protein B6245_24050 [Desulfobacteraceae bacterium 4572_88]|nr:MAG: hypothetical protein B6245_24050 [Desulfobacteraceae bacterium 4572_88]
MENLFKEEDAAGFIEKYADYPEELALRAYTSRLIGGNSDLVLHGGGNTSVKLMTRNIVGQGEAVIYVKASGWDMAFIEPEGFTGLRSKPLEQLCRLDSLSSGEMDNQLKIHRTSAAAQNPSVEALLHVFLPHKYVDHTHADSILILTNQKHGEAMVREALGEDIVVLPYVMSGFPLAKAVWDACTKTPEAKAVIIMNHGIFTFAEDARTAYDNMIRYVSRAEAYIHEQIGNRPLFTLREDLNTPANPQSALTRCAQVIRGACAHSATDDEKLQRLYVETRTDPDLLEASLSDQAASVCRTGVLTPDHAIRTKNLMAYLETVPEDDVSLRSLVQQAVDDFQADYHSYLSEQAKGKDTDSDRPDSHPVLFWVAGVGLMALGETRKAARIAADIGEHTIRAKLRAFAMGEYEPIPETHVSDMEHLNLQERKLQGGISALPLQGQVAVITGGGGAIGFGIAKQLLAAGAAVVISDIDAPRLQVAHSILAGKYGEDLVDSVVFDVTDFPDVERAFADISARFGGIDILVPNAGIAHVATIEELDPAKLDQVIAVNLRGTFTVIKAAIPIFRRQGSGGNIVMISTKNVFDPGACFSAYSASKAGAHQLAKIAAMELAELGVRVNMINPDAIFGDEKVCSGLWELVGPDRMKSRGLDPQGLQDYYCQRSLLKVRVLAEHVGNAVVFFASDLIPTTGASLPVDGGNPAAFPR